MFFYQYEFTLNNKKCQLYFKSIPRSINYEKNKNIVSHANGRAVKGVENERATRVVPIPKETISIAMGIVKNQKLEVGTVMEMFCAHR